MDGERSISSLALSLFMFAICVSARVRQASEPEG